ncbi:hypothetical protein E2C01_007318 [Portunus trituberculatus]|uniref:Uncharacterized protein n=1 Tax=Portunus trituberculatus TaxID=210409 RepID=A0A5B7CYN8_PORTR|nr:hypothetical protein [Portunus trituberculatus]
MWAKIASTLQSTMIILNSHGHRTGTEQQTAILFNVHRTPMLLRCPFLPYPVIVLLYSALRLNVLSG